MVRISAVEGSEQPTVGFLVDLTKTIVRQRFRVVGNVAEPTVVSGRRRRERSTVFGLFTVIDVVGMRSQKGDLSSFLAYLASLSTAGIDTAGEHGTSSFFCSATRPPQQGEARGVAPPPHDGFAFIAAP